MGKWLNPLLILIAVLVLIGGIVFCFKNNEKNKTEITDYKTYSVSENKEFGLYKESNSIIYDVLTYEEYIDFCNVYEIEDTYTDNNQNYILACIKAFSIGIEHHNFKILTDNNTYYLYDDYTWGATGDKYGLYICIPVKDEDAELEYINKFQYKNEN